MDSEVNNTIDTSEYKSMVLDLKKYKIPRLYETSLSTLDMHLTSGWYKVNNSCIEYTYEKEYHTFHLKVPKSLNEFSIFFVPYTTGKYEEEEKYKLEIKENKIQVYLESYAHLCTFIVFDI